MDKSKEPQYIADSSQADSRVSQKITFLKESLSSEEKAMNKLVEMTRKMNRGVAFDSIMNHIYD